MKVVAIVTGLLIASESLALLTGMHLVGGGDIPWITRRNDLFLALDVIAGVG